MLSPMEIELYVMVNNYLKKEILYALPNSHRTLITSVIRKLLASSSMAVAETFKVLKGRLETLKETTRTESADESIDFFLSFFDDDEIETDDDSKQDELYTREKVNEFIQHEIDEVTAIINKAESIKRNAKMTALKQAVETAFAFQDEAGIKQRIVVFTESIRTQQYMFEELSHAGYEGQILKFNGSTNDPVTKQIYKAWKARNYGKYVGSRNVELKNAIVEAFRDEYKILLVTDSGSEGLNLQFCNTIINYDLPWNPQKIEQRIGRCHRYGQKNDVVVINLLNTQNVADKRVYEILSEKFELFQGVFGASDKAIGLLESGADFEKRVTLIYQECKTTSDFTKQFKNLEKELEKKRNKKKDELKSIFTYKTEEQHKSHFNIIMKEIAEYDSQFKYWNSRSKEENEIYPKYYETNIDLEIPGIQHGYLLIGSSYVGEILEDKSHDFALDTNEYKELVGEIDGELQNQNVDEFISTIYEKIFNEYVKHRFSEDSQKSMGIAEYNRYASEQARDADEDAFDYADLGKSFFLNDIIQVSELVQNGSFGDGNEYEKKVIEYILAGYEKSKGPDDLPRTIISPDAGKSEMKLFFDRILNVTNSPRGKWPAKYMPALMQQVAVNIAIRQDGDAPVFSVNGPPGTGKTTLLKEIVASNIVERARLLAENAEDSDSIFEMHSFSHGPLEANENAYYQYAPHYYSINVDEINNYSMLVASCNNAAVENITIDLPKARDILDSLESSRDDEEEIRCGLDEVHDLFDINKSGDVETITRYGKSHEEKDIYFTRYADKLLGGADCWGLISAPFGRKANIRKYCNSVLKPFVEDYKSNGVREQHKAKYLEVRKKFLSQYKLVESLRNELEQICALASSVPVELQENAPEDLSCEISDVERKRQMFERQLFAEQKELIELEESRPKGLFARRKDTSARDIFIQEKKATISKLNGEITSLNNRISGLQNLQEYQRCISKYSHGQMKMTPVDAAFMERYVSEDDRLSTKAQITNPWFTAQYNREREKLFLYACKLHKEFVISSKCMRHNIINLMIAWNVFDDCGERMKLADREEAMPYMLQSIFLLTPVISTTFASAQTFLGDVKKSGVLGTLIVDEAGQAQPQMAVGAMFRCRKAIIVGDPKQIEPVVTAETDMIKQLLTAEILAGYKDKKISVQAFADYINPYGTYLGKDEEKEWVGCPLVVHRRCIDPMYTISNVLSYDGTMKQQTAAPKADRAKTFILDKSCWIDVAGAENSGKKDHFVKAQGELVLKLLARKFERDPIDIPRLFIITPFTSVKEGMLEMIKKSELYGKEPRVRKWLNANNIGTVHTFQGQGTDEVIFLLGCDSKSMGAVNWVNNNIVNVAATRAKFRFYMIGDKSVWTCRPVRVARECTAEILTDKEVAELLGDKTEEAKSASLKMSMICPECGKKLVERSGKFGKFIGCSGFPKCRFTQSV